MSDKLSEICACKRLEIRELKSRVSLSFLELLARNAPDVRGFEASLSKKIDQHGVGLITEIKKASPSAGLIRADFDPGAFASAYEQGGAACLSVLTDAPFFQGAPHDLGEAREACDLPVLRKDFILDPWQVAESRAMGADAILLIVAALDDAALSELFNAAREMNLDVLLEIHDEAELERALALPSGLIGINNRNLKTLETDLAVSERLAPLVPKGRTIVSESGIKNADDLSRLVALGIRRFLVGESLMRQRNLTLATKALRLPDNA